VEEVKKKYIKAHCFKKGETRHFRRKRTAMEKVIPLHKPPKPQKDAPQKIFWGWINPPTPTGNK
jgi:predicted DNA-binding transcriptional regulator YafY